MRRAANIAMRVGGGVSQFFEGTIAADKKCGEGSGQKCSLAARVVGNVHVGTCSSLLQRDVLVNECYQLLCPTCVTIFREPERCHEIQTETPRLLVDPDLSVVTKCTRRRHLVSSSERCHEMNEAETPPPAGADV